MDKLKFAILNIWIPVAVSVFVFIGIYANGFCSALENVNASSSAFEVIQGGANKGNGFYYSLTPEMYGTLGPMALDELNAELYSKYGWDFETIAIDGADDWTNDLDPQIASQFGYQVTGQTLGNLAQTVIYKISTGLGKMFGIGEKSNDILSVVHNGSVYYVDENTLDRVKSTRSDLINNGDFTLVDNDNSIYSRHIKVFGARSNSLGNNSILQLEGYTNVPICYYTNSTMDYNVYYLLATIPASALTLVDGSTDTYVMPFNGYYIDGSGTKVNISEIYLYRSTTQTQTINNIEYMYGRLHVGRRVGSKYIFGSRQNSFDVIQNSTSNGVVDGSTATLYKYSNESAMNEILSQLEGKFVTSTDMQRIVDLINNLQYGLITDNGNTLPVIDTNAEFLSNLQSIVNQILTNEQTLADVLNRYNTEPEPEPDPIENINQGIDIPNGFDNSLLNPFVDVIKLPFKFFTIFSPVFAIFGNSALFGLWLFFPSFLIIMVIIWSLK